jgi:hypothetical protein
LRENGVQQFPVASLVRSARRQVAPFTDRIEAAHEFSGVFWIDQFLERMGQRRDARFFILLADRNRIAIDRINYILGDGQRSKSTRARPRPEMCSAVSI